MKKTLSILILALVSLFVSLTFIACDSDIDAEEDVQPQSSNQYFDLNITSCERIGSNLLVKFTLKNKQNKALKNIRLTPESFTDNLGNSYYTQSISFGGIWTWSITRDYEANERISGMLRIFGFDSTNSAKKLKLKLNALIEGKDVTLSKEGVNIVDNRVLNKSMVTNDPTLSYTNYRVQRTTVNGNPTADLNFKLKNVSNTVLNDLKLIVWESECKFMDNMGQEASDKGVSINGGEYSMSARFNLAPGETANISIRGIFRFANTLGTSASGFFYLESNNYPLTDNRFYFYSLPIQ